MFVCSISFLSLLQIIDRWLPKNRNLWTGLQYLNSPCGGMFRKLNNVFRPNHQGQRERDGGSAGVSRSEQDYHSACTVRLVRSTSVLVVGQRSQAAVGSTLKRSKSTLSIESNLYCYQRQEDRIWLYSQSRDCLEYLEALVELRRKYGQTVRAFKRSEAEATVSLKKKPPPPPPGREEPVRI